MRWSWTILGQIVTVRIMQSYCHNTAIFEAKFNQINNSQKKFSSKGKDTFRRECLNIVCRVCSIWIKYYIFIYIYIHYIYICIYTHCDCNISFSILKTQSVLFGNLVNALIHQYTKQDAQSIQWLFRGPFTCCTSMRYWYSKGHCHDPGLGQVE